MNKFLEVLANGKGIFKKVAIGAVALAGVAILAGMMTEPAESEVETSYDEPAEETFEYGPSEE